MTAVHRDLTIEAGTTWSQSWQIRLDGADLDPGWHARSQVRTSREATDILHEFTCNVTGSVVQLSVLPDESSAFTWWRGVFDVEIVDASDPPRVVRIVEGSVTVIAEVTR